MKNRILAAMALCCATSSTMPLWAAEYDDPTIVTVEPNLATDGTGGGKYYIYHVATRKFIAAGNASGTQLSVDSIGQEITMAYGEERPPLLVQKPKVPGKGWIFNMLNGPSNGNRFHEIYVTGTGSAYVDCGSDGHTLWQIKKQENGYYAIKIVDQDPDFGTVSGNEMTVNGVWGVNPGSTVVYPFADKDQGGFEKVETDWAFVTPEAYFVYQAKKALQAQLEFADENGYTDVANYVALYEKTDATAEELESAADELQQAVTDRLGAGASEEQPKFTDLLANPSFDADNSGWIEDGGSPTLGHQKNDKYQDPDDESVVMDQFCEKWTKPGGTSAIHLYQKFGNMPSGRYRLSAVTLGYNQSNLNDIPRGLYLFADASKYDEKFRAEAHTVKFYGIKNGTPGGADVPTPRKVVLEFYSRGGDLTLGFMTENTNCNWFGIDNVKLEYMGSEGGLAAELARTVKSAEAYLQEQIGANAHFSASGKAKYEEVLAYAKEAAGNAGLTDDDWAAAIRMVNARKDSLAVDIATYKKLNDVVIPALENKLTDSPYSEVGLPSYEDYLDKLYRAYDDGSMAPAEIDGAEAYAEKLFKQDVADMMESGATDNVTGLLVNPSFAKSNDGWTKTGNGDFKNEGTEMTEVWNGRDWEVYQDMTGLPEGFYKITMQGFYSPSSPTASVWHGAWGLEGDEVNKVKASVFGNEASALLHHIADFPRNDKMTEGGWEQVTGTADDNLNGKWLPTDKASSQAFFKENAENYLNTVSCYVGEDGKLRVGVKLAGVTINESWVTMDNFQVLYLGLDNQEGAVAALQAKINEARQVGADGSLIPLDVQELLQTSVLEAEEVIKGEISGQLFKETMASLSAAIEQGHTSIELLNKIDRQVTRYDQEYNDGVYDSYDQDDVDALLNIVYEVMDFIDGGSFESVGQIEQYIADMNNAYGKIKQSAIDFSVASKDEPLDVTELLENPSFQQEDEEGNVVFNYDGWEVEVSNNPDGAAANDSVFEFFNNLQADIHQGLYCMKQGYYRVKVYGFYRYGDLIGAAIAHRDGTEKLLTSLYVQTETEDFATPLASLFECVHDGLLSPDDALLPDSLFPGSDRTYHCVADKRLGARAAMTWGYYEVDKPFYVKEGESVVVGVRKDDGLVYDWVCIDDFSLEYLGDGETNRPDDFVDNIDEVFVGGETATVVASEWYTINGVRVAEPKQRGIYIRRDKMSDGTVKAVKVMVK